MQVHAAMKMSSSRGSGNEDVHQSSETQLPTLFGIEASSWSRIPSSVQQQTIFTNQDNIVGMTFPSQGSSPVGTSSGHNISVKQAKMTTDSFSSNPFTTAVTNSSVMEDVCYSLGSCRKAQSKKEAKVSDL